MDYQSIVHSVDLLVVLDYEGKSWEKATEIHRRFRSTFPLDTIIRSQAQLDERVALGDPFMKDILRDGTRVYEPNRHFGLDHC